MYPSHESQSEVQNPSENALAVYVRRPMYVVLCMGTPMCTQPSIRIQDVAT